MKARVWLFGCAALLVAACEEVQTTSNVPDDGFYAEVPESVLAVAAPGQDLTAVRMQPSDGCFVYRYAGPVETTLLPLRTVNGNPICAKRTTS